MGFSLYILFMTSWFVHLTARIPVLGMIRFDFILVAVLFGAGLFAQLRQERVPEGGDVSRMIMALILYIILTVPFVQWPGSVISSGLPGFVKAFVFYFFTISFVTTERRLKIFLAVFVACQSFRVFEPVFLHLVRGYWGSVASMANWESMERLSGAPLDVVNPNGLAFIIDTVIALLVFLSLTSWKWAVAAVVSIPVHIYALMLTGSRSGFVCLLAIMGAVVVKSRRRALTAVFFTVALFVICFGLSATLKDRYLSILVTETKNAPTAEARIQGVIKDLNIALRKPVFGHGIGTSREANANFGNDDMPAHNLFVEAAEEIGFAGLVIFILYIKTVITCAVRTGIRLHRDGIYDRYLVRLGDAIQVWLFMNLVFSLASYGLSSYEWYLFGGLTVVLARLVYYEETLVEEEIGLPLEADLPDRRFPVQS